MTSETILRRPSRESSAWLTYQARRYTILFYVLLLTLLAMPVAMTLGLPALLLRVLIGVSLVAAVMPSATRRSRNVLLAAALLLALMQFVPANQMPWAKPAYALGLIGLAGLAAAAGALRFAVKSKGVTGETIYAALGAYLLAGIFFGQIYWAIETIRPGSIVGPDPTTEVEAVYYSFVTLATLGYGDYLPRTILTRGIATFEVIGGQLYLAVLVARLIGAFSDKES